jgi:hypothetical protein
MQSSVENDRTGARVTALTLVAVVFTLTASACSSLYTESASAGAGIAGAAVASRVTNNAAVATGIGLGTVAAARAGVQYTERVTHNYTQNRIAQAAGPLSVGAVASWSALHKVPLEPNGRGRVTVSRIISSGVLECKEIVFSVDKPAAKRAENTKDQSAQSEFFVASICRDGNTWKWASAEPATSRWSPLQ